MFLHIGQERSIFAKDIIAILDLSDQNLNESNQTIDEETPKSLIITNQGNFYTILSTATLTKRIHNWRQSI